MIEPGLVRLIFHHVTSWGVKYTRIKVLLDRTSIAATSCLRPVFQQRHRRPVANRGSGDGHVIHSNMAAVVCRR